MTGLAVFTEQRCWVDDEGLMRGRKDLGAVSVLAAQVDCTVIARPSDPDDGSVPVLPQQNSCSLLPWPGAASEGLRFWSALSGIWSMVGGHSGVLVYAPGVLGSFAGLIAIVRRRPLLVIAVGDPRRALAPEMFPGIVGTVLRLSMATAMSVICRHAKVVRYVTTKALQRAYPPGSSTASFGLTDTGPLVPGSVRTRPQREPITVLTVASLDQPYKGVAELIEAIGSVREGGHNVRLKVVGAGRLAGELEQLGKDRLGDAAAFVGHLNARDLAKAYQEADCFVLASWAEGLPRALVEAMSFGLPAVATSVGGVPELLEGSCLVPPRSSSALAATLKSLLDDSERWHTSSRRNMAVAIALSKAASEGELAFVSAALQALDGQL